MLGNMTDFVQIGYIYGKLSSTLSKTGPFINII